MDFRVEITDPAIDDLSEIVSYIAQDNPDAASVLGVPVAKRQSFAGKQFGC
jgi:plasmid stabilization system protein ParE